MNDSNLRLSYTSRDFSAITNELKSLIRETRPDLWSDFFDSNTGMVLVELAALVGDMLSYGQDITAQELFLATCRRYESGLRAARSVGYVPRTAKSAVVQVRSIQVPDSLTLYGGVIPVGSKIVGQNGLAYELLEAYTVEPGDSVIRMILSEGVSYTEVFPPVVERSAEVTSSNGVVGDGTWEVYVGDVNNPANLWEQVDNVQFEAGATNTYDVYFDDAGRLHARFGDGNAGKIPDQSITLRYRVTAGLAGNTPAGTLRGSLSVNLSLPATGTVSVEFENRDLDLSTSGGTQFVASELVGAVTNTLGQNGTLALTPLQSGTLTLTISLSGGAGTVVLQDNGSGEMSVVSNTTVFTVVTTFVTYSTGSFGVTFSGVLPAGGTISATYFALIAGTAETAAIIGAAVGGEDRESLRELKQNVPAYVRSQNKVITLQDYNESVRQVGGVALVFTDLWISSYTANAVKIHVWTNETIQFQSEDSDRNPHGTPQSYLRYAQTPSTLVPTIVNFMRPRTLATVHNFILRPIMLWADVYLGEVVYDSRVDVATVRDRITRAVLDLFEQSTGFVVRISELYNSIRDVVGVRYFQIQRVALGNQASSDELQGATTSSPTVAGTLLQPTVTPGTVVITIQQTGSSFIRVRDTADGQFAVIAGVAAIISGSIDYHTGAWTITFAAPLIPNQNVVATYADVDEDRRRQQVVTYDATTNFDRWPPPGVPTAIPPTPPYMDGKPSSATRYNQTPVVVFAATHTFSDPVLTVAIETTTPHDVVVGAKVMMSGFTPSIYNGLHTVTAVIDPTNFEVEIATSSDPGAPTFVAAQVTLYGVTAPYLPGDVLEYPPITDIEVTSVRTTSNFYDETYQYNNEIYYDSVAGLSSDVRAINLRRLAFDLTPG